VANYHAKTIAATCEIMEACGFGRLESVHPSRFFRRVSQQETKSFEQIYFSRGDSTAAPRLKTFLN
jgi:hypothetical protein